MCHVWRLNKIPQKSNSHSIGFLSETWKFSKDRAFDDKADAEKYIIDQNYRHSGYELHVHGECADVIRKRCLLDDSWASYWVCFLDEGNFSKKAMREKIINQLQERRIMVRET